MRAGGSVVPSIIPSSQTPSTHESNKPTKPTNPQAAEQDLSALEKRFWTTIDQSEESCLRAGLQIDLMKRALDPNWMASYHAQLEAQGLAFPVPPPAPATTSTTAGGGGSGGVAVAGSYGKREFERSNVCFISWFV